MEEATAERSHRHQGDHGCGSLCIESTVAGLAHYGQHQRQLPCGDRSWICVRRSSSRQPSMNLLSRACMRRHVSLWACNGAFLPFGRSGLLCSVLTIICSSLLNAVNANNM